ncbi:PREDICTED: venom protease [Trachymyrmex septentrionalis]|uniref:venom protease n=1 Tax=Trachymyrmex septentrionalis TaxID=34720 RepID=UPI00084F6B68|nr:PREDICTED: venom protease [Trachymyrmex septentrionalis]XP_018357263.1 PREDICTED: venom protease [Trachymyrmex septentrionalis]
MRTIIFVGLLCALILSFSEGSTIGLKSVRELRQSTSFVSDPLSVPQCGISNVQIDRIVGGTEAKLGEFPWIVRLGTVMTFAPGVQWTSWMCGGTLITNTHILTAAHCFSDDFPISIFPEEYIARIADLDFESSNDGAHPVEVLIKEIMLHAEYDDISHENDVAVLKIDREVQFTSTLLPACLPIGNVKNENLDGKMAVTAGWGYTEEGGTSPSTLMEAELSIISNEECQDAYSEQPYAVLDKRTICAASPGKDSCQGDSGGPLMIQNGNKTYVVGIVSWGIGCARQDYPGVYTRVTEFLPFIEECIAY